MNHPIYRIEAFERVGAYALKMKFNDGAERTIDFEPVLAGELFGPLREPSTFARVTIDLEVHTLVWPDGADFDPATLHDWPIHESAFREAARRWRDADALA